MGNIILKKDNLKDKKTPNKKKSNEAVLSNVPGVAAPPTIEAYDDNNNRIQNRNEFLRYNNIRQSQIDSLPRHTAGSGNVVQSIAKTKLNSKVNENNNNNNNNNNNSKKNNVKYTDSLSDLDIHKNNKELNKINKNLKNSGDNLSIILNDLKQKSPRPSDKIKNKNIHHHQNDIFNSHKLLSVSDNESEIFNKQSKQKEQKKLKLKNNLSQSSSHINKINEINNDNNKNFKKKRDELFNNLLSLNKIENEQKNKILEQERILKIQNMKLKDALLIRRSLTNFSHLSDQEDNYDDDDDDDDDDNIRDQYKYYRQRCKPYIKSNTSLKPITRKHIPMRFPSIVTKYEAQSYEGQTPPPPPLPLPSSSSLSQPVSSKRHYYQQHHHYSHHNKLSNLNYYRPHKSLTENKIDLYLETTEDIIDSRGRILSSNQTCKYLGEADANIKPKVENIFNDNEIPIYTKKYPEIEINNHKYEIIDNNNNNNNNNNNKNLDVNNEEINEIIKIIEETEKREEKLKNESNSTYYLNGHLIKRTNPVNIPQISDDLQKPSFTIPEKIYKSLLTKKKSQESSSQSLRASSQPPIYSNIKRPIYEELFFNNNKENSEYRSSMTKLNEALNVNNTKSFTNINELKSEFIVDSNNHNNETMSSINNYSKVIY